MDDTIDTGQSADWTKWMQDVGGGLIGAWSNATYQQPYDLQRMRIQSLGDRGYYLEGKPGVAQAPGGISPLMLIGGGVLLLVVLLVSNRGRA